MDEHLAQLWKTFNAEHPGAIYIIKSYRNLARRIGYALYLLVFALMYFLYDYGFMWYVVAAPIPLLFVGGVIINFIIGRKIENRTGFNIKQQMQLHEIWIAAGRPEVR